MSEQRVLIVEDETLISASVAAALTSAGYEVQGIATSEAQALAMAEANHPDLAIVDVRLAPGSGKVVARILADRFNTTVLMATSENPECLDRIGASAVLPKPYDAALVPEALQLANILASGGEAGRLPDHMKALRKN